jgi:hypothetical protein
MALTSFEPRRSRTIWSLPIPEFGISKVTIASEVSPLLTGLWMMTAWRVNGERPEPPSKFGA